MCDSLRPVAASAKTPHVGLPVGRALGNGADLAVSNRHGNRRLSAVLSRPASRAGPLGEPQRKVDNESGRALLPLLTATANQTPTIVIPAAKTP